jgi:acyl-CoA thioesterase
MGEIHPGWDVVGNAHGGYLMALAARAMAPDDRPDPVTFTTHFLAPGRVGPVSIDAETVKAGRTYTTVRGVLASDRPLLATLGTFGDLSTPVNAPERVDAAPPELPPAEDCIRVTPSEAGFPPPFMDKVDLRIHPGDANFGSGEPTGRPMFRGWFRLEDEDIDTIGLLLAVDSFPPTIFNAHLPIAWTPTLELTAHIRARPVPGWLRCQFTTRFITGGTLEEDGEVWDCTGRLVAQSRQLALLPRG